LFILTIVSTQDDFLVLAIHRKIISFRTVALARAIATSKSASAMVGATAGQAAAAKSPAARTIDATASKTAARTTATTPAMISRSFIAQTSKTTKSTNRASTCGKNAAQIRATRSLAIVSSMRAIIRSMMTPPLPTAKAAAAGAATAAMRARAAAMVVL